MFRQKYLFTYYICFSYFFYCAEVCLYKYKVADKNKITTTTTPNPDIKDMAAVETYASYDELDQRDDKSMVGILGY